MTSVLLAGGFRKPRPVIRLLNSVLLKLVIGVADH